MRRLRAAPRALALLLLLALAFLALPSAHSRPLPPGVRQTRVLLLGSRGVLLHATAPHPRSSIPSYLSILLRNVGLTPEIHVHAPEGFTLGPNPWSRDFDPNQFDHPVRSYGGPPEEVPPLTWPACRGREGEFCDQPGEHIRAMEPTPPMFNEVGVRTPLPPFEDFRSNFVPPNLERSHCFDERTAELLAEGEWDYVVLQDDLRMPYVSQYALLRSTMLGAQYLTRRALEKSPNATVLLMQTWPVDEALTPLEIKWDERAKFPSQEFMEFVQSQQQEPPPGQTQEQANAARAWGVAVGMSERFSQLVRGWIEAMAAQEQSVYAASLEMAKSRPNAPPPPRLPFLQLNLTQHESLRIAPVAVAWELWKKETGESLVKLTKEKRNRGNPQAVVEFFKSASPYEPQSANVSTLGSTLPQSQFASPIGNFLAAATLASSMVRVDPACEKSPQSGSLCAAGVFCPKSTWGLDEGLDFPLSPFQHKGVCSLVRASVHDAMLGELLRELPLDRAGDVLRKLHPEQHRIQYENDEPEWEWVDDVHGEDNGPPPEGEEEEEQEKPKPDDRGSTSTAAAGEEEEEQAGGEEQPKPEQEKEEEEEETPAGETEQESDATGTGESEPSAGASSTAAAESATGTSQPEPSTSAPAAEVTPAVPVDGSTGSNEPVSEQEQQEPPSTPSAATSTAPAAAEPLLPSPTGAVPPSVDSTSSGPSMPLRPSPPANTPVEISTNQQTYPVKLIIIASVSSTLLFVGVSLLLCYWWRRRKLIPYQALSYHAPPPAVMTLASRAGRVPAHHDYAFEDDLEDPEADLWARVDGPHDADAELTPQQMRAFKAQQAKNKKNARR